MNKIIGISLLIFTLISLIFYDTIVAWDDIIFKNITYSDTLTNIMKVITEFGSALVLIILTVALFIKYKKKLVIINLILVFLLNNLLKNIVKRSRPEDMMIIETSYSFPSGHAMISTAFYGLIIYYIIKSNIKKKSKILISILLGILILLISFSRVYLKVHYFSDIYFGILFGIIFLYILIIIKNKYFEKK